MARSNGRNGSGTPHRGHTDTIDIATAVVWSVRDALNGGATTIGTHFQRTTREGALVSVWSEAAEPCRTLTGLKIQIQGYPGRGVWPNLPEPVRIAVRDGKASASALDAVIGQAIGQPATALSEQPSWKKGPAVFAS